MTVLVGYLPTAEGEAAFAAALDEAARRSEPLLLINSPRSGAPVSVDAAGPENLALLTARAVEAGVVLEIRQPPHTGEFAETILAVADEADASLIVIGLRRRSPVGKLFLGSAAQQILLHANRPVLAVKPAHH
jgi:nucleotide-binding universal stress UspA family protein